MNKLQGSNQNTNIRQQQNSKLIQPWSQLQYQVDEPFKQTAQRSSLDPRNSNSSLALRGSDRDILEQDYLEYQKTQMVQQCQNFQNQRQQSFQKKFISQQDFQNINKDLTIVKSVKDFKQYRHTLYKWSQVLEISNKLVLVVSLFYLFVSIIQTAISAPPFLVSLSAQSLNNTGQSKFKKILYGLQIFDSLLLLTIAILGTILRTKLQLSLAEIQTKVLVGMPIMLGALVILQGFLSYMYLDETCKPEERQSLPTSYLILGICTAIFTIMQAGGCIVIGKVHTSFKKSLEDYIDFLLKFEETPRSKFAKKYIPPLDVLEEETNSHYTSTVRGSSNLHIGSASGMLKDGGMHASRTFSYLNKEIQLPENQLELEIGSTPELPAYMQDSTRKNIQTQQPRKEIDYVINASGNFNENSTPLRRGSSKQSYN